MQASAARTVQCGLLVPLQHRDSASGNSMHYWQSSHGARAATGHSPAARGRRGPVKARRRIRSIELARADCRYLNCGEPGGGWAGLLAP